MPRLAKLVSARATAETVYLRVLLDGVEYPVEVDRAELLALVIQKVRDAEACEQQGPAALRDLLGDVNIP